MRPLQSSIKAAFNTLENLRIHQDLLRWLRDLVLTVPERLVLTEVQTGTYTARPWDLVQFDNSAGTTGITLPDGPDKGTEVGLSCVAAGTSTRVSASGDDTVLGAAFITLNTLNEGLVLVYDPTRKDWRRLG